MIAMQYTFSFPDDFDMHTIRTRVAERGHLFDKLDGLYEKAFLISEKGIQGASKNTYAPFYLWNYSEAISNFLASDKFKAVSDAFGRPAITSFLPFYVAGGKAKLAKPVLATKETLEIPANADVGQTRQTEYRLYREWAEHPHIHSFFIGLDPHTWRIVRFALWAKPLENLASGVETFEVLHLSAPGLDPNYVAGC